MKRTVEENRLRRERYATVKKATGSYKLAQKARDHGVKTILQEFTNIRIKKDTGKIYVYYEKKIFKPKEVVRPLTKREFLNKQKRDRHKKARDLNYTPEEAKYLRGVSQKKFDEITRNKSIINNKGREDRWSKMSRRSKYDASIIEACEAINLEAGYDIDSRYGWAVYYFYYVNGGDLESWKEYVEQDPFVLQAVIYIKENLPVF